MKTDIWHTGFKQDINRFRVLLSRFRNIIIITSGSEITTLESGDKWCYFEDYQREHQEQSSKIERLEKALEVAKGALVGISIPEIQTEMFNAVEFSKMALEQITKIMENNNAE